MTERKTGDRPRDEPDPSSGWMGEPADRAGPEPSIRDLPRVIGFWDSLALVVGLIIGSGIFRAPASVAEHLPAAALMMTAWVIGGALSLAGGIAAAELGVRFPRSGGQYVFLRESFGPAVAFAFGWSTVLISKPSILAGIATVFAIYMSGLAGLPHASRKPLAMGAILVLTVVNCLGVKSGTRTQNVLTAAKTLGLGLLGVGVLAAGRGTWTGFGGTGLPAGETVGEAAHGWPVAMALGLITILYTYDGWIDVTYTAGEVMRPRRVLPRAILFGTCACVGLYLLANAAYLYVLTPAEMAGVDNVAAVALDRAFGPAGGTLLSVLVVISTLGILNGSILTGVRVPFAMAQGGMLFRSLGRVHARSLSPVNALLVQGSFACLVVFFAAGFDEIASLFVDTTWLFYAVSFAGLLVIRRRERRRPLAEGSGASVRLPGSAPAAVLFIIVTLFIIGADLAFSGRRVLIGMGVVVAAVPVYWLWRAVSPRS